MHDVLVDQHDYDHVARLYRIDLQLVYGLVKKAKTNRQFIRDLWDKEDA